MIITLLRHLIQRALRRSVSGAAAAILALLLACPIGAYAEKVKIDALYFNLNSDDATAETAPPDEEGSYVSGVLTIPETVTYGGTTYTVTGIGDDAFSFCTELTSVTIPASVTRIGSYAFAGCQT